MIVICEPQSIGFEHAGWNSVLMTTIMQAFQEEILFLGEESHVKQVKEIMDRTDHSEKIYYNVIEVPPKEQRDLERLRTEFKLTKEVFSLADSLGSKKVIFSSVTRPGLISVKYYIRKFQDVKVLIIPHSLLDRINELPLSRDFIFYLKFWLRFFNTERLKYLILGKTIRDELVKELPQIEKFAESVDHPFFFKNFALCDTSLDEKLVFGFLGVGYRKKGIESFIKLASGLKGKDFIVNVNFILAGFIAENDVEVPEDSFLIASKTPLDQKTYFKYLNKINYALFFHKPEDYRLTASGVFFDAISYLKPIIAIKNPFFQYYFDMMGDIGFLCEDYEEMENVVVDIIKNPENKRYHQQQLNLKNGREKISISKIADQIRLMW